MYFQITRFLINLYDFTGCSTRQTTLNGQLLEIISDMSAAMARLEQKMDALAGRIGGSDNTDKSEENIMSLLGSLPVQTAEEFLTLENKLRESGPFQQRIVSF